MFYLLLFLLFLAIYFVPKVTSNIKFVIIVVVLSLVIIFRSGVGADYYSYTRIYNRLDSSSILQALDQNLRIEPFFRVLIYISKRIGFNSHVFIASIGIIINTLVSIWIFNNSKNQILSLLIFYALFFLVWPYSALRQGLVLAIGSILFFSRKSYLNFKNSIIVVVLLALIHVSALLYIPLLFLEKYEISDRNLSKIFVLSVLISFIPIDKLLVFIDFIPGVSKLLSKSTNSLPFFRLSFMIRFIFACTTLILLNKSEEKYFKKLLRNFVIGFSIYFTISFSETIASRVNIFTYFLIILIIPEVLNINSFRIKGLIVKKQYIYLLIIPFLSVSILKEVRTLKVQSYYLGDSKLMPYTSIFNADDSLFGSQEAHIVNREREDDNALKDFHERIDLENSKEIDSNTKTMLVNYSHDNRKFVINQFGEIVFNENIPGSLELYDDVILSHWSMPLFNDVRYFDITDKDRSESELINKVNIERESQLDFSKSSEKKIEVDFSDLPEKTKNLFANKDALQNIYLYEINKPFSYKVLVAEYQYSKHYAYLKTDMSPLINDIFIGKAPFNKDGFLKIRYQKYDRVYNSNGKLIWID